jgi:hypothetical protein
MRRHITEDTILQHGSTDYETISLEYFPGKQTVKSVGADDVIHHWLLRQCKL